MNPMDAAPDRLRLLKVRKTFGGLTALDDVTMTVAAGTVHGLLGENGAGKSTLLKILSGVLEPTAGAIEIDGKPVEGRGPLASRRAGIAMIHQELQHVPELTVAQNMFLGRPMTSAGGLFVDRRSQELAAAGALAGLDATIDPAAPIRTLKVAQRQIVEIARALLEEAKVIAMDEPTSSLTPAEFERLAALIADLAAKGVSVIYVSHKMDEVFRVCRTATILRDGRKVDDIVIAETNVAGVVGRMVGRQLASVEHRGHATNRVALEVRGLTRGKAVIDASFSLHEGEVLGISGLVGAGRTELLRLLAGVDRAGSGEIRVGGKLLKAVSPRAAIAAGLGLLPEERKRDGIVPQRSILSNIALSTMKRFSRFGLVRRGALSRESDVLMRSLNLRPMMLERPIGKFSGGNQQKAIIGRWIAAGVRILLFDEPTRGIDVGAKAEIYALIERLAAEGRAIIVVSSELPEILRLSDRVLVMREGRIAAMLDRSDLSEEAIVAHAIPQSAKIETAMPVTGEKRRR